MWLEIRRIEPLEQYYYIPPKVDEEEKLNWLDTVKVLTDQVMVKIVMFVRHIEKLVNFKHVEVDEHESMFDVI